MYGQPKIDSWALERAAAKQQAVENLAAKSRSLRLERVTDGILRVRQGDGLDGARLLLPDLAARLAATRAEHLGCGRTPSRRACSWPTNRRSKSSPSVPKTPSNAHRTPFPPRSSQSRRKVRAPCSPRARLQTRPVPEPRNMREHPYAPFIDRVHKPAQYLGGEQGEVRKAWDEVGLPDLSGISRSV